MLTLADVLEQLEQNCPELQGAVVATHDGLVLAASANFSGDVPAACAASLAVQLEQDLTLIQNTRFTESLIWSDPGIWYLAVLNYNHRLLAHSRSSDHAGALRLAGQIAAMQLNTILFPPS